MRGPTQPVCQAGQPCDEPAVGLTLTFTRNGTSKSVRTNRRGEYRIALAPGTYSIRTDADQFGRIPEPSRVRIRANTHNRLDLFVDTGIR
jgi:hypothetical protein